MRGHSWLLAGYRSDIMERALRPRRNPGGLREEGAGGVELRGQGVRAKMDREGGKVTVGGPEAHGLDLGVGDKGAAAGVPQRASPGKEQARNQKAA